MRLTAYFSYCTLVIMSKTTKRPRRKPARKPRTMTLRQWCDEYGHGARAFLQKETGLRWQTIHDQMHVRRRPSLNTAQKIDRATKGAVPWTVLFEPWTE